jgi:hypothetical protein
MNKADGKNGSLVLSKIDKHIIKSLTSLKFIGLYLALMGGVGVLIGLYSTIYRPMTASDAHLNRALTFAAIAFIGTGWYLYNITRLVKKLKEHCDSKPEMQ